MINYSWTISSLETAPSLDNLTDVVRVIHWRYSATEVDGDKTYQAETYSTFTCSEPSPNDFTAYPDLTEADVISWLESGLNVEAMQESLANQIADLKNPKIVSLPLPWSENNL
jgi:hypothetical protein